MENLISKRFVMRKALVGQNVVIEVSFKNGRTAKYDHDKAYEIMKDKLEAMPCWEKYKSYTATNNLPMVLRGTEAVIELTDPAKEEEVA